MKWQYMVDAVLCITVPSTDIKSCTLHWQVSQFGGGGSMLTLIAWSEGRERVLSFVRKDSSLVECQHLLSPKIVQIHISMCFPVLTTITLCLCLCHQVSQSQWTSDSQVCEPFALSWPKQFLSLCPSRCPLFLGLSSAASTPMGTQ